MKIPIPTLTAVAAALAAVTVAGCTPAAPSPTPAAFSTLPSTMPIVTDLPSGMNPDMAAGAAFRGHPFVAAAGSDCRIWMRLPSGQVWSMPPLSAVNRTGTRMKLEDQSAYAESMYWHQCKQTGPAPDSGAADPAAVAAARAAGVPYIATAERWDDGCHAWITLPNGSRYGIDKLHALRGAPQLTGDELTGRSVRAFGCGGGYGNGVALPGQTASPKGN